MKKPSKKASMTRPRSGTASEPRVATSNFTSDIAAPGTTGRYLVLLREGSVQQGIKAMQDTAGLRVASSADFDGSAGAAERMADAEAVVFHRIGACVVNTPPEQIRSLSVAAVAEDGAILAIEPERVVYAIQEEPPGGMGFPTIHPASASANLPFDYLRGYRDAVNHVVDKVLEGSGLGGGIEAAAVLDESELTWGLQVTKAAASRFSGRGVRVAVLDTGLDMRHPDFAGRQIVPRSFIPDQAVQDRHGHGTHCIGTACGPQHPGSLPRYGVAYDAEIFAGKVLSNQGDGADAGILAGIEWAVTNGCPIISMSLGSRVFPGQSFSPIYEQVAQRALAAGTLMIAAAGNESQRPGFIAPVSHPANCPSIMAVAALDVRLQVAAFSCGGLNPQGGQVDVAGPGVNIRSSWPRPMLYNTISGTSMATPHIAGIAALYAEANPDIRGRALANLLIQSARRLTLPSRDIGSGLAQAP